MLLCIFIPGPVLSERERSKPKIGDLIIMDSIRIRLVGCEDCDVCKEITRRRIGQQSLGIAQPGTGGTSLTNNGLEQGEVTGSGSESEE